MHFFNDLNPTLPFIKNKKTRKLNAPVSTLSPPPTPIYYRSFWFGSGECVGV